MKAVQLIEIGQPLRMRDDVPIPEPDVSDVLVRVIAAGICHSDAHYRAGTSPVAFTPLTLGHEVAGVVERVGNQVTQFRSGDRVSVHYMVTCGECTFCARGSEQFCVKGQMIGKHRHGGYAEYILVPARSLVLLPPEVTFEHGAVMMCSTSTSFHALRKGKLQVGERVAVFGAGGLGMSAIQLAKAMGALDVYAIDINPAKLAVATQYGAIPVNASQNDPVTQILDLTHGKGVDVALELIGLSLTMKQAVQCLSIQGRAVMVGIGNKPLEIDIYTELLGKEAEIVGASDHLLIELPQILEFARRGWLSFEHVVTQTVPLDAGSINGVLDALDEFRGDVRTVIVP
ncbi:MAG: zinc-binding dehydrogenase [Anaerolineae bacterium]|nr:zinc-binding dehydrogenase [Anaerolineae bacterium]